MNGMDYSAMPGARALRCTVCGDAPDAGCNELQGRCPYRRAAEQHARSARRFQPPPALDPMADDSLVAEDGGTMFGGDALGLGAALAFVSVLSFTVGVLTASWLLRW